MKILLLLCTLLSVRAEAFEIQGVPFVKQASNFCGPASLESVMSYYGVSEDQDTIARSVYCQGLEGSLITDLENYARLKGFKTKLAQGGLDDIEGLVRENRPVIVLVDMGFWVVSKPHYLVVTGVTDSDVVAHTGHEPSRRFSREDFTKIWKKKGSVYLVIHH
ncbi:MAG TPA: cysteine peptidase family C39 domain-containing protein [Deltaproteobacteria bacterium]|mgnify:CR=1 FL=1|nr:cysteine peptidase family C39 domain-containing protein [Deltaproteobacteria bacterium]HOI06977.1 cysteine peptidase family C39 domain-containing protein [Deltaproteobacteria bacterium]